MKVTGAELLVKALEAEGVEVIFGYPGGTVLPIYDKLYDSKIKHILTRHEQGAAHAADGFARATGKPGVVIATSGPGACNLVTGIANAYMDSVPLVVFTGQVGLPLIGKDSFQEADITGITLPVTKHNFLVKDVNDLAKTIQAAFHIATTGRPGPVLIDLPKDITTQMVNYAYPNGMKLPGYKLLNVDNSAQLAEAIALIKESERPVIYAGGGVVISDAGAELQQLAEKAAIPVTTTLMGLSAFPGTHPLSLGMLGMHGTAYANYAVSECDLLIAIGARFDDRVTGSIATFAPHAKIIHIDIDPAEISKNVQADVSIVGDARKILQILDQQLDGQPRSADWLRQVNAWKMEYPLAYNKEGDIKPQYVIEQIYELTKGNAIIATDVGQHQMWTAQFFRFAQPRSLITSGGLGTMGFGVPAALGAQVGRPDALVFDIAGDGSFQMNSQELATAAAYNLPVKIAILNNRFLGMVRQWQEMFHGRRYSQTDLSSGPDFVKLAEAYGVLGLRATTPEEVRPVLEKAIATQGPVVMDFVTSREENVFPMVPPGGSLNKMIQEVGSE